MADKIIENNQVSVMGKIATGFTFSHQVLGRILYNGSSQKRLSDSEDRTCLPSLGVSTIIFWSLFRFGTATASINAGFFRFSKT